MIFKTVLTAAICIGLLNVTTSFPMSSFCQTQCVNGRGGNLCNCNTVHFAGKRDGQTRELGRFIASRGISPDDLHRSQAADYDLMETLDYIQNDGDGDYLHDGGEAMPGGSRLHTEQLLEGAVMSALKRTRLKILPAAEAVIMPINRRRKRDSAGHVDT